MPNPGEIVLGANRHYDRPPFMSVPVLQLSYDDRSGRFPWEPSTPPRGHNLGRDRSAPSVDGFPRTPHARESVGFAPTADVAASAVGISSTNDADDDHVVVGIVDAIDHPVGAASGAVSVVQRWTKSLADALRVVEQGPDDETRTPRTPPTAVAPRSAGAEPWAR